MKIAIATQDLEKVDAHFGWAKHIAIYDLSPAGWRFSHQVSFYGAANEDGDEGKLQPRLQAIEGCTLLYVAAIGGSAAAQVVARKIHPIKVRSAEPINQVLEQLRKVLANQPPPWLRKAMMRDQGLLVTFDD